MELFIWILFAYGACNILVYGSNFKWWRDFLAYFGTGGYSIWKLFNCMMCLPTWVGIFMSFMARTQLGTWTPSFTYGIENLWIGMLVDGVLTSGCVWLIHTFQEMMERTNKDV